MARLFPVTDAVMDPLIYNSANAVSATTQHVVAPAPQHAGTADQRYIPPWSARPPSDAETAEDLTDRIAGILAVIRQYGQREFAAVARAKAAARKAEEAAKAATVDVLMDEGTGFGVVDSEEQI
ncbi:hypothetical protein K3495_g15284 [Podosphaera aphanis]|nr:hypothetical protein K3495_g15284 [Podosphaera aphanis]